MRVYCVSVRSMDGCLDCVCVLEGRSDSFCGNLGHFLGFDGLKGVTHDGCLLTVTVYLLDQKPSFWVSGVHILH